jgi:hypothetical protein
MHRNADLYRPVHRLVVKTRASEVTAPQYGGHVRVETNLPPGTQAQIFQGNGLTQTITTLHVRATEFTVGERGPEAMPGELPLVTGYTYASEITVDEAVARIDGKDVVFNRSGDSFDSWWRRSAPGPRLDAQL